MREYSILQWNQGGRGNSAPRSILGELIDAERPSIILLQEASASARATLTARRYQVLQATNRRVLTAYATMDWTSGRNMAHDAPHYALALLNSTQNMTRLAVWNIHLRSRSWAQDHEIEATLRGPFLRELQQLRQQPLYQGCSEIVAGDFNLSPFMNAFWEIGANRCLTWALRQCKNARAKQPALYNPSWSFLRAGGGVGGTYYKSGPGDGPWFVYDQALITPGIAIPDCARLVTRVGTTHLTTGADDRPDSRVGSDHFPVVVKIKS